MPKYRFCGDAPGFVPDLHRVLQPGEEFESELAFSPALVEVLEESGPSLADLDISGPDEAA